MSAMNITNTAILLAPDDGGRWILRTYAMKKYNLAASDLDSILPRSSEPNRYGSRWTELKYNESDVVELAARLNAVLFTGNAPLAMTVGPEIARLDAMIQYKITNCQMDRIQPVRIEVDPDPNSSTGFIKYYNQSDVVALSNQIWNAATHPTCHGQPIPFDPFASPSDDVDMEF
ncbi:uncharacterized protein STEHIDRAFT_152798 [Stereum hirsutum FP-91666 SS1]|uniref:uncharacterized protein n=1 Tax=Stereum hirsutum (strain FP-91666) TaxID=721885 RepID=UPI000440EC86|nr:uncharacterized protein STEHIDRAFT_152798 [Stereum hirsutum FP-91666 SS1]EIM91134.1 hypothetical protein STEHIDRAFT_152798 [Stereum hirsutum FP-91666 SS1]